MACWAPSFHQLSSIDFINFLPIIKQINFCKGAIYNNAHHKINVYGDDVEVDYRGYEVCTTQGSNYSYT